MNGEVENNNEKKKQVRLAIIGVVALLLLTLGATFAFFLIDTDNSTSKSQINADIEDIDSIALQKVTENLHVNLSAVDMAEANKNTEYFGDDTANYVKTLEEGMHNLGKLTAKGGNGKTRYMCTANAVITMQVANDNDMGKFFNTGDAYLYLNAGSLQQRIDLSELKTSGTKTIPFEIGITSESERQIDGYVEIINTASDQTYLANKTLNIDITFQDLECNVGVSEVETYLRENDKENKLTTNLVNSLYRYQGNSIVNSFDMDQGTMDITQTVNNNYICLGSDCSTAESNDMYRIIGVTEDGEMKVIKSTPIEQDLQWWTDYNTDIKWPQSLAYQYLNTEFYQTLPIELKEKIVNAAWLYGDVNPENMSLEDQQKMNEYADILGDLDVDTDTAAFKKASKNYTKLMSDFLVTAEAKATNIVIGDISLMSLTDYCSSFENDGEYNCMSSMIPFRLIPNYGSGYPSLFGFSWLSINSHSTEGTWTMSRVGYYEGKWSAYDSYWFGFASLDFVSHYFSVNPVFYLTSDVDIKGLGTIDTPFTIGIE